MIVAGARSHAPRRPPGSGLRRISGRAVVVALALSVAAFGFVAGRGAGSSLALLVSSAQVGGNVLTAGTWYVPPVPWYLHNNPTPPVGNTSAQSMLTMTATSPSATTLFNYDTNQDSGAGRSIARGGSGPGETIVQNYAVWRSDALPTAQMISGSARLTIWSATASFVKNRAGGLVAYLRDYDPASGTYAEIANGTRTSSNWQAGSSTWVSTTVTISVTGYLVAAGHRLEVKVETAASSAVTMWVAYDTTSYASQFLLP